MSEASKSQQRPVDQAKPIGHDNSSVDMDLYRKFQEAQRILDSIPSEPEPEPEPVKMPHLRSTPLGMFD